MKPLLFYSILFFTTLAGIFVAADAYATAAIWYGCAFVQAIDAICIAIKEQP